MIDGIGSAVSGIRFTFQYGSTLIKAAQSVISGILGFTFQYGSTLIMNKKSVTSVYIEFTFQYGSTLMTITM